MLGTFYFEKGNGLYIVVSYETQEAKILMEEFSGEPVLYRNWGQKDERTWRIYFPVWKNKCGIGRLAEEKNESIYAAVRRAAPGSGVRCCFRKGKLWIGMKRSGFVSSENYADEQQKKNDLYLLKAGSCFETQFEGEHV